MPTSVYLITGPEGKRYVGITTKTALQRWAAHCGATRNPRCCSALHRAILKYGPDSFVVEVLETYEQWEEGCAAEKRLIAKFRSFGPGGYNLTLGGDGRFGSRATSETRAKMSKAARDRREPPTLRQSLRAAHANRPDDERAALAEKISAANARRSARDRARISEAISASKRGKSRSAECIEKQRLAMTGRKLNPRQVERIREANTGRTHSAESIAKMSEIALRRRSQTSETMREVWRKRKEAAAST